MSSEDSITDFSKGGSARRHFGQLLLFSAFPGLALFIVNQLIFNFFRHSQLPLEMAALYCLTFFVLSFSGGAVALVMGRLLGEKRALKYLSSILGALVMTGIIYYIVTPLPGKNLQVQNFHLLWVASLFTICSTFILAWKGLLRGIARWTAAGCLLMVMLGWALLFPEQRGVPDPQCYWLTAAVLAFFSGILFLLRIGVRIPLSWEAAGLAAVVLFILSIQGIGHTALSSKLAVEEGSPGYRPADHRPNIVFIILDTVRKDHLSLYGYHRKTSPFIDAMAEESEVYTQAVTVAPWTLPSHVSMFTGLYTHSHGMEWHNYKSDIGMRSYRTLPDNFITLAEVLTENEYRCGGVSANFPFVGKFSNMHQGFEYFDDKRNPFNLLRHFKLQIRLLKEIIPFLPSRVRFKYFNPTRSANSISNSALVWLDSLKGVGPFFLFINYMDAHEPLYPPSEMVRLFPGYNREVINMEYTKELMMHGEFTREQKDHVVSQYDSQLYYLDREVAALMEGLKDRGVYHDAYIIITSDHGQFLGEHGLMGHGFHLYSEVLDIPLIIKHPGGDKAGVNEAPIENRMFFFMILEMAGIWMRREYYPWDAAANISQRTPITITEGGKVYKLERPVINALLFDGYKYMAIGEGREELYEMSSDPDESDNLIDSHPLQAARGRELLQDFFRLIPENLGLKLKESQPLSPEDINDLRALGYIK